MIAKKSLKHYREQLLSYGELVERATGSQEVTTAILHLPANGSEVITITKSPTEKMDCERTENGGVPLSKSYHLPSFGYRLIRYPNSAPLA
jgi:hypothetical protein